jgi:hypothetical protein
MRVSDALRLGYGLALLVGPRGLSRTLTRAELDRRAVITARVLGARHLLQGTAMVIDGGHELRRAGRATDLLHAASMSALAAWSPGRTRLALTDAVVATALAWTGGPRAEGRTQPPRGAREVVTRRPPDLLDLPGPARPAAATIFDAGADHALERRQRHALLQRAVHRAFQASRGRSLEETRQALLRSIHELGLSDPPAPWLDSAAAEIAEGNIYVVSGPAMQDLGLELPPHHPL